MLTEYLSCGITISSSHYASIIERLRCAILEKHRGKVSDRVLFFHDNALFHKCNIVQTAVRKTGFVELNDPAYSSDIAWSNYYLFSNLKKFVHGQNFSRGDETIDTGEDYGNNLGSEFFCKNIRSSRDCWQRVLAA